MKLIDLAYFSKQIIKMHLLPGYRVPLSVYLVLTYRCNNSCVYCRAQNMPEKDGWSIESLKTVFSDMKACGVKRLHLTGGEPMLREDIGEIISYAKGLGFFVGMSTNGFEIAARVKELKGIDVVFLSYDGPPEVHARLRGKRNVEEVQNALCVLKQAGIRVWTSTTLTRWNAGFIDDIVDFSSREGTLANFNRLEFFSELPGYLHPHINEIKDLILSGEERKDVFRKLIKLKLSGAPVGSSLAYLKNALEWPYDGRVTDAHPSKRYRCWAGRAFGHLEVDGSLHACGWGALRQQPGINVLKEGFCQSWDKLVPLADCKSCSHACGVENNLLFSLNCQSILNAFIQLHR
jgi:MoaA/NifB/PqqE/SkfB family radical SAM enzyme